MSIYKVKHYWKDGASSTWEADKGLDKDIFEYLKKSYHSFVEDRPKYILYKNYKISFYYEDKKDSFGRDITNINFTISKKNKTIIITFSLLLVLSILIYIYYPKESIIDEELKKDSSKDMIAMDNQWELFIKDWNNKLDNDINNKFYIDKNNTPKTICNDFNNWLQPFHNGEIYSNLTVNELEKRIKEITKTRNMTEYFNKIVGIN